MQKTDTSDSLVEAMLLLGFLGYTIETAMRIREMLGSESAVLEANRGDLQVSGLTPRAIKRLNRCLKEGCHLRERDEAEKRGIKTCFYGMPGFPDRLIDIPDAPLLLFIRGAIPMDPSVALAVVGSRRCTPEGRRTAWKLASEMAEKGIPIVSGMARGIDEAAIRGCVSSKGSPVGVLGCGLDVIYPSESAGLFQETGELGALVSEFPLGTPPLKQNFPRRNRIISGLADGLLVVEASKKSGSLITVDHALSQDRTVMAVPGPVGPASFRGTNTLIRDGASVVLEAEDIDAVLSLPPGQRIKGDETSKLKLEPLKESIYRHCRHEALTVDVLVSRTKTPYSELISHISGMETDGLLERVSGGRFMSVQRRHQPGLFD